MDRKGADAMRMTTLTLLALFTYAGAAPSLAAAQSPDICAPVEQLDKYRYLRQLTLDLYGRIPTVEEYEQLHAMDDVSEAMIDEMLASPEFYGQLRRYHRNLLWSNLGDDDLVGQEVREEGDETFRVWVNRDKRDDYRGADVLCLDMEHTNFDAEGRPLPMIEDSEDYQDNIPAAGDALETAPEVTESSSDAPITPSATHR